MQADNPAHDLETAFRRLAEGRHEEGARICAEVLAREPSSARGHYLLGMSHSLRGKYEEALPHLRRAAELDPGNIDTLYNIGAACWELKRHEEAMDAYRKILEIDPRHAYALHNAGVGLVSMGDYAGSAAHFRRALEALPGHDAAAYELMKAESQCRPMGEWAAYCDEALARKGLTQGTRYVALVHRAAAEWATGDMARLELTLGVANVSRPREGGKRVANMRRYEKFLKSLMAYRESHPELYAPGGTPLFMAGDSHCLSYAGLRVGGQRIESYLIVGAKAWHLASKTPNKYTAALDAQVARLPRGSRLLAAFGEIDCRVDGGIMPYWKNNGGILAEIAAEQAARYVDAFASRAKGLNVTFLSTPAPHRDAGDRREVTEAFNKSLAARAAEAGHGYIDLYTPARGADGYAEGSLHIDEIHLKPEALIRDDL